jgi:hypothetical protein
MVQLVVGYLGHGMARHMGFELVKTCKARHNSHPRMPNLWDFHK